MEESQSLSMIDWKSAVPVRLEDFGAPNRLLSGASMTVAPWVPIFGRRSCASLVGNGASTSQRGQPKTSGRNILVTYSASGTDHNYAMGLLSASADSTTDLLVYHARSYKHITGDPLDDPNRHTRVQAFHWNEDGTPHFGEPLPDSIEME